MSLASKSSQYLRNWWFSKLTLGQRIRRVKCDELKPSCNRCLSTGRKCDGYITAVPSRRPLGQKPKSHSINQPNRVSNWLISSHIDIYASVFDTAADGSELRCFEYFQSRVNEISGYVESDFWNRLVLQVSLREPTVRYALLALSSLYQIYGDQKQGIQPDPRELHVALHREALRQYTRAVGSLSKKLLEDRSSFQVALITCLLFIWLEFLRNDYAAGLQHLNSGFNILQDVQSEPNSIGDIDPTIVPLFERVKTQVALHGCPQSDFSSMSLVHYPGKYF